MPVSVEASSTQFTHIAAENENGPKKKAKQCDTKKIFMSPHMEMAKATLLRRIIIPFIAIVHNLYAHIVVSGETPTSAHRPGKNCKKKENTYKFFIQLM